MGVDEFNAKKAQLQKMQKNWALEIIKLLYGKYILGVLIYILNSYLVFLKETIVLLFLSTRRPVKGLEAYT